ncbi:MAG: flagellar hook-basal body complex protein [Dehalococcoidia bacterium]
MTISLDAALSGLLEQQRSMENIANNIANANTTGYKRLRIHFSALLDSAQIIQALNGEIPTTDATTAGGVETASVERVFQQGTLQESPSMLDFAIVGPGLFRVTLEDGSPGYTRDGAFHLDASGALVMADGTQLDPPIVLPEATSGLRVGNDGHVYATRAMTEDELAARDPDDVTTTIEEDLGPLTLVRFEHPEALISLGRNIYVDSPDSGPPIEGVAGDPGFGTVTNGFLEASNVEVAEELTQLIAASRAYQINLSAYRTIEEMLRQAGQLPA